MSDAEKPKFTPVSWSMGGSLNVQPVVAAPPPRWWQQPMNSQPVRTEMARQIITRCGIQRFVETGTFAGSTTAFLAQYQRPVVTIEINQEVADEARKYLKQWSNVDQRVGDSVEVMRELIGEWPDRTQPTLFYLDAHWHERLPLREEVELAFGHFAKAVALIDDFAVPGDEGYAFDDYGPGKRLDIDYLLSANTPELAIYFPSTPSAQEGGPRRGCAVVTADPEISAILDDIALLRRWKP